MSYNCVESPIFVKKIKVVSIAVYQWVSYLLQIINSLVKKESF